MMKNGNANQDLVTELGETGWSEKIETGFTLVDEQHRRYFSLVNDCLAVAANPVLSDGDLAAKLGERLGFLRRYAVEHFATEQRLMKESGYSAYQQHFEQHMYFLQRISALDKQLRESGHSDKLLREVHFLTLDWFISHIQTHDVQLVAYLDQRAEHTGTSG